MGELTYICSKCKVEKLIFEFGTANDRTSGHKSQCKGCCAEYRKANRERLSVSVKRNAILKKDEIKEKRHEYYLKNKEKIDSNNKKWREANKDIANGLSASYYKNHKERLLNIRKEKKKLDPEYESRIWQKRKAKYGDELNKKRREYTIKNPHIIAKSRRLYRANKRENDPLFVLKHSIRRNIGLYFTKGRYIKKQSTEEIIGCSFEFFKAYIESKFEPWMDWSNYGLFNNTPNYGWDLDHKIPVSLAETEQQLITLNHYTNFQPMCSYENRIVKNNKLNYKAA